LMIHRKGATGSPLINARTTSANEPTGNGDRTARNVRGIWI